MLAKTFHQDCNRKLDSQEMTELWLGHVTELRVDSQMEKNEEEQLKVQHDNHVML